jgi:hypothetical protein
VEGWSGQALNRAGIPNHFCYLTISGPEKLFWNFFQKKLKK